MGDGEKVLLFLAAANRDPRRWDNADTFDVRRRATGHMTFGTGIHGCVGQAVARLESEAIFGALAKRVAAFELTGEPQRRLNNTLRGLDSLPLRIVPV
jgi:cytochrome P450